MEGEERADEWRGARKLCGLVLIEYCYYSSSSCCKGVIFWSHGKLSLSYIVLSQHPRVGAGFSPPLSSPLLSSGFTLRVSPLLSSGLLFESCCGFFFLLRTWEFFFNFFEELVEVFELTNKVKLLT